jgi:hypothetical protein
MPARKPAKPPISKMLILGSGPTVGAKLARIISHKHPVIRLEIKMLILRMVANYRRKGILEWTSLEQTMPIHLNVRSP